MNDSAVAQALGNLKGTVDAMADQWRRQEQSASEGRRTLHGKVDDLAKQQASLASQVAQQTLELAEVKPAIKRFEADRQRREGANSMVKLLWGSIIAFATGLGYVAHELMVIFWPPKGH